MVSYVRRSLCYLQRVWERGGGAWLFAAVAYVLRGAVCRVGGCGGVVCFRGVSGAS